MDHLTSNSLLKSHQSAYCKHYSTETALLYIHDHLISAGQSASQIGKWRYDSLITLMLEVLDNAIKDRTTSKTSKSSPLSSERHINAACLLISRSYNRYDFARGGSFDYA